MKKTFREYYAAYYENITADSVYSSDDEATGTFLTKEFYTISDLWKEENGMKKATFNPYVIDGIIKRPKDIKRSMPFSWYGRQTIRRNRDQSSRRLEC
ncbi:MAG: hypothetical protein WDO71_02995 [Bacteroidota bacterium]